MSRDPDLSTELERLCQDAFRRGGLDPALGSVHPSERPDLGDFQCNGLLASAKALRISPGDAFERVAPALEVEGLAEVSFARPGFLNFRVSDAALMWQAGRLARDERFLLAPPVAPERYLLDYGGPNLAKEMHVGHLRSSIVGQALKALLLYAGHAVESDVHLGDWGLQLGQLIAHVAETARPDLLEEEGDEIAMADLQRWYPEASARSRADEAFLARAREATAALQAGEPGHLRAWRRIVAASEQSLRRDFDRLGVEFDHWFGESRYQGDLDALVERLLERGVARHSEGAVVVPLPEQEDLPPLMLRNSQGAYGYGATDLATVADRTAGAPRPDRILYVVDGRQRLHFRQVFLAAELCGLARGAGLEHIAFGTVNGPDGKPFKTRAGGVMRLHDLLEEMHEAADARLDAREEVDGEARRRTAEQVAIAAIKFGELSHDREGSYVFDIDSFTRLDGRTGPYLQYTCVRVASLLDRAAAEGLRPAGEVAHLGEGGRELILALDAFAGQVGRAVGARKPSVLAMHAYAVANRANAFYQANRVLGAEGGPERAGAHLELLTLALRQIGTCLGILGIEVPDQM